MRYKHNYEMYTWIVRKLRVYIFQFKLFTQICEFIYIFFFSELRETKSEL